MLYNVYIAEIGRRAMSKILAFLMPAVMIFYYLLGFGSIKTDGDYTVV